MRLKRTARQKAKGKGQRAKVYFCLLIFALCLLPCRWLWAEDLAAQRFQTGLAYERLGRYDDAYTELQLAFALDQNTTEVAVALGVVATRLGRLEVAQRSLERSVAV